MTALNKFDRLESTATWRTSTGAQLRDVIVSIGDATLTISDQSGSALAHWSLPAIERLNPGERPAVFRPGPDAEETLELADETMVHAISTVQNAIERRRPHPGRLRQLITILSVIAIVLVSLFWLPGAMMKYTVSVVPSAKRVAIGEKLLTNIQRVSGNKCASGLGQQALDNLHLRLLPDTTGKIFVLSGGVKKSTHLPGNIILLNRLLVEDYENAEVGAGFILVENELATQKDPLLTLLQEAGFIATFRLLTTGNISDDRLITYGENLLIKEGETLDSSTLIGRFETAKIHLSPYAYALDITGETTIDLIEADALNAQQTEPVLSDNDWVSLQGICGE